MSPLSIVLIVKIMVTAIAVSIPFMFLPTHRLAELLRIKGGDATLFRLYGVAVTALLVGYGFGLVETFAGQFPTAAVAVGIVSNGAGASVLVAHGGWIRARFLTGFFVVITSSLLIAWICPELALAPLSG